MKRIVCLILALIIALGSSAAALVALADSRYNALGTNKALGSPILDTTFSTDDWNKWEMICWGVFLSNFSTPLIDNYQTAFSSSSSLGSKGAGYKALVFGSGSDPANADTIKSLLSKAQDEQQTGSYKDIMVIYSYVDKDGCSIEKREFPTTEEIENSGDIQADFGVRRATFKDLFLKPEPDSGESEEDTSYCTVDIAGNVGITPTGAISLSDFSDKYTYMPLAFPCKASLPTFGIEVDNYYETVFDYTDSWDSQLIPVWMASMFSSNFASECKDAFEYLWQQNPNLMLDCFGNITVEDSNGNRVVVIPASANQHITQSPQINLANSLILNGSSSSLSGDLLNAYGKQTDATGMIQGFVNLGKQVWGAMPWTKAYEGYTYAHVSGLPALDGSSATVNPGTVYMYFDSDTILAQKAINAGVTSIAGAAGKNFNQGEIIKELFDLNAKSETYDYTLKIESGNFSDVASKVKDAPNIMVNQQLASQIISNITSKPSQKTYLRELLTPTGKLELFGTPTIVPVQMKTGKTGTKLNRAGYGRKFIQFLYEVYEGNITDGGSGSVSSEDVSSRLEKYKDANGRQILTRMAYDEDGTLSSLVAAFIANNPSLYKIQNADKINFGNLVLNGHDISELFKDLDGTSWAVGGGGSIVATGADKENVEGIGGRYIKAYPMNNVLIEAGKVLGLRDGTETSMYSTYLYLTYLDFYGIINKSYVGDAVTSNFNTRIFSEDSSLLVADINSIATFKTVEDKKKEVLNYAYLMVQPEEGREYRKGIMIASLSDFIYETYQRIVYGQSSDYYSSTYGNLAGRNANGFLDISTYTENFMTGWLMKIYPNVVLWVAGIAVLVIFIIGVVGRRKISWFLLSIALIINCLLLTPSIGEVTPYVANEMVERMFEGKMTFWSVSEAASNAILEASYSDGSTSVYSGTTLSNDEKAKLLDLVKSFKVVYLDRSLMIKNDISKKVTSSEVGNLEEVQKLKSARWMLPMIMRQFTSSDKSADYVYTSIGDMYDNLSNMYWLYVYNDAESSGTIYGSQATNTSATQASGMANVANPINNKNVMYPDYKEIGLLNVDISDYNSNYKSAARAQNSDELTHTYFWLLNENGSAVAVPPSRSNIDLKEEKIFDRYFDAISQRYTSALAPKFNEAADKIEQVAGTYVASDRSTVNSMFGYLWTTESPFHYFYQVGKSTLKSVSAGNYYYTNSGNGNTSSNKYDITSLGSMASTLTGSYKTLSDGSEVRTSFMHMGTTGKIRDILDLEELFTNVIPYMYEMDTLAGGTNGTNGFLGDTPIKDYELYEGTDRAWLFRSNWVTKIMENKYYNQSAKVKDKDGNLHDIVNPLLPDCYPVDRPMVFSEAQMYAQGLSEGDLNIVELECIDINKNVSKRWTNLVNYVNVEGVTKEVIYRQMATEAIFEFNKGFSPSGMMSGKYALYPQAISLRAISFDSIMKMLMLNITKDSSYIYAETMKAVTETCDIFSAVLLLACAFMCSMLIPLARDISLGIVFYVGFIAICMSMFSGDSTSKKKAPIGYLLSNVIICLSTLVYYSIFGTMMAITNYDSVLTVQSIQVNVGNPVWCFLIILGISIAYAWVIIKYTVFIVKNYRDVGYGVYAEKAGQVAQKMSDSIDKLTNKLASGYNYGGGSLSSGTISGRPAKVIVESGEIDVNNIKNEKNKNRAGENQQSSYSFENKNSSDLLSDPNVFDSVIDKSRDADNK